MTALPTVLLALASMGLAESAKPDASCEGAHKAAVERGRTAAMARLEKGYNRIAHAVAAAEEFGKSSGKLPPRERTRAAKEVKALSKAYVVPFKKIFSVNPKYELLLGTFDQMYINLREAAIACHPSETKECGGSDGSTGRGAYTLCNSEACEPTIHLCPGALNASENDEAPPEEKLVRHLIHESAHLTGVGLGLKNEPYCFPFTCDGRCGRPEHTADGWSHYAYCMSLEPGQKLFEGEEITVNIPKK